MANHMTSRYGGQQGSFAESLAAFAEQTKEAIDDVFREVVIEIGSSVIRLSPVDTGRFKGNWQFTVGAPSSQSLDTFDKSGHETIAALVAEVSKLEAGQVAYIVNNLGIDMHQLPTVYLITGVCTIFFGPLIGKAADTYGKFRVFTFGTVVSIIMVLVYTRLGSISLPMLIFINSLMFVGIFSRMIPFQALVSSVPAACTTLLMLSALRCSLSAWSMLAACPTTCTCSVVVADSAALSRSLAIAMARAVSVKPTNPAVLLRLYMNVLPQESVDAGQVARQLGGQARVAR